MNSLRVEAWKPSLNAEYESLQRETDPEFRDLGLLAFARRLTEAGQSEDALSLYQSLSDSDVPRVRKDSRESLGLSPLPFGRRFERWLEGSARVLGDPKIFLSLAVGSELLWGSRLFGGRLAFATASDLSLAWGRIAAIAPKTLGFASLGLLAACSSKVSREVKSVRGLARHESLALFGDRSVGELVYIRQVHHALGLDADMTREIAEYQTQIFRELESGKYQHVFLESYTEDHAPRSKFRPRPANLELIRSVFPSGFPKELNAGQRKVLFEEGGGLVYAALHDEVSVHKTWTPEEGQENYEKLFQGTGRGGLAPEEAIKNLDWIVQLEKNIPHVFSDREAMATREVMEFLSKHPGERAVLIFGAAHEFEDDFGRLEHPPILRTIEWRSR